MPMSEKTSSYDMIEKVLLRKVVKFAKKCTQMQGFLQSSTLTNLTPLADA
jgi:hypothetical protein